MKKLNTQILVSLAVVALGVGIAKGQNFSINWSCVAGGGGGSSGGPYSVSGTIGQPAVGQVVTGNNFSLTSGFWSSLAARAGGAPRLVIRLTATNSVIVSWPSSSAGFTLKQNSDLTTSNWVLPAEPVIDDGTTKFIVVNPPAGNRYYRLTNP
jgi:hypothetical protein